MVVVVFFQSQVTQNRPAMPPTAFRESTQTAWVDKSIQSDLEMIHNWFVSARRNRKYTVNTTLIECLAWGSDKVLGYRHVTFRHQWHRPQASRWPAFARFLVSSTYSYAHTFYCRHSGRAWQIRRLSLIGCWTNLHSLKKIHKKNNSWTFTFIRGVFIYAVRDSGQPRPFH